MVQQRATEFDGDTAVTDDIGFGVYIHWPFCAQKCPYCDFNSHVRHGGVDQADYLNAYKQELRTVRDWVGARTVSSIFFGGGTPSLMQPQTVAAVIDEIADLWDLQSGAEITLEANPNSVEAKRFKGFYTAGVNRVSIGVQSLRDEELKRLGRLHSVAEARTAIDIAGATFDRFSFDLIYARPNQTPAEWKSELGEALSMGTSHLSLYQLTIEPDTPFAALHAAGKLIVPGDDDAVALYDVTQEMTAAAGLPAYETSNHAAPGQESQHNLLYWRYGCYAGIGPGAHGRLPVKVGEKQTDTVRIATSTQKMPETWAKSVKEKGHGFTEQDPILVAEAADEMLLMGLRLKEGLNLERMQMVSGFLPTLEEISALKSLGLLAQNDPHIIHATEKGAIVLDELVRRLSQSIVRV
ncbi:MAG: radical SAM family heme chaperone HemW [Hyphomicrobiaceae bacterium]